MSFFLSFFGGLFKKDNYLVEISKVFVCCMVSRATIYAEHFKLFEQAIILFQSWKVGFRFADLLQSFVQFVEGGNSNLLCEFVRHRRHRWQSLVTNMIPYGRDVVIIVFINHLPSDVLTISRIPNASSNCTSAN